MIIFLFAGVVLFCSMFLFLWGNWIKNTYKKEKKILFSIQLLLTISVIFWAAWNLEIFPGSSSYYERLRNEKLTGERFWSHKEFCLETPSGFNGDGYSICVYSFDDDVSKLFLSPQKKFFTDYPIKPEYREDWEQKKWNATPINSKETIYLNFALTKYPSNVENQNKLQNIFNYIREAVNKEGSFYSYNVKQHSTDWIGNIDFYFLSPKDKKLIKINHNT